MGTDLEAWSSRVETLCKDVECTFGILKKRFLFLKHPIRLHEPKDIENCFLTCCLIHNWLLEFDGRDDWEEWLENLDDDDNDDGLNTNGEMAASRARYVGFEGGFTRGEQPGAYYEIPHRDGDDVDEDMAPTQTEVMAFTRRRQDLIEHFIAAASNRALVLGV